MAQRALLLAALLTGAIADAHELSQPVEAYFGDYAGCALIQGRDRHHSMQIEFNLRQCDVPLSPCSTFKIPNALIGLQTGVLSSRDHTKNWDGEEHDRPELNRDHNLASAIRHSVVWYFQDLAKDVGEARMSTWLAELGYGNQDISGGIDRFWLASSLKVDAHGQMRLLKELHHGTLPFLPEHQRAVRELLALESGLDGRLHGKTGSCRGDASRPDHGWFIGWLDAGSPKNPWTTYFVVNIRGADAWGSKARDITLELLDDLQH